MRGGTGAVDVILWCNAKVHEQSDRLGVVNKQKRLRSDHCVAVSQHSLGMRKLLGLMVQVEADAVVHQVGARDPERLTVTLPQLHERHALVLEHAHDRVDEFDQRLRPHYLDQRRMALFDGDERAHGARRRRRRGVPGQGDRHIAIECTQLHTHVLVSKL